MLPARYDDDDDDIMKVIIILDVIGALGIVTKRLIQGLMDLEIRRLVETIQTTALMLSGQTTRRIMET